MDKGDEAYGASWSLWRPKAAAYARAFGVFSIEERFEIADEAIARAYAARARFDASRDFSPWFFAIVRRLCLDALKRKRELRLTPEKLEAEPARSPSAEEAAMADEELTFIRAFVSALPRADRELSSLVFGRDLSVREAAVVLGRPEGTLKWRLHKIRKALREAWERAYGQV
jgi:RNA polymerase sigma factor (sigma-70 family)